MSNSAFSQELLNIQDQEGMTSLHRAIEKGHLVALTFLLVAKADPNIPDNMGWTALHWGVRSNRPEIVRCLLDANANIDNCGYSGHASLHLAYELRSPSIYRLLQQRGAKWDVDTDRELDAAGLVALAWGIGGNFTQGGKERSICRRSAVPRYPTLSVFSQRLKHQEPKIAKAFEEDSALDLTLRLEKIRKGALVTITAGTLDHATVLVFYKGYFAICDRSEDTPIKVYKINPTQMTPELLQKIVDVSSSFYYDDVKDVFYNTLPLALEARSNLICRVFNGQPLLKPQQGDTCSYASPKAALFTILALKSLFNSFIPTAMQRVEKQRKKYAAMSLNYMLVERCRLLIQQAKVQYKEYTTSFRLNILYDYLYQIEDIPLISKAHVDRDLLEQIQRLLENPNWHPERFNNYNTPTRNLLISKIKTVLLATVPGSP